MRHIIAAILTSAVLLSGGSSILAQNGNSLPSVKLDADNLGPRSIEDLTSKSVPRDYANAWQTMAQALAQNRVDLLNGYFTGFAKEKLTQRIEDQTKAGIRTRYTDHGHNLTGLFYSPAGDAMQLRDEAKLDIQILNGDKVIDKEQVNLHYQILMTPGADRWLVRDLQTTQDAAH